eukprot:CAMPEP_0182449576 /NCGR_PEP_ID=MMETSP1172-20130603/35320_1 /TAXON_ID=708627 /ORGANISM="Timspurckia oligopyrenoides, Strain CCMP3278" /LENGTH=138 /DNA_ID=CAMNT_0024646897 /DNA_START=321 /DNA_END=734 /DNA_ORIENTATION=-
MKSPPSITPVVPLRPHSQSNASGIPSSALIGVNSSSSGAKFIGNAFKSRQFLFRPDLILWSRSPHLNYTQGVLYGISIAGGGVGGKSDAAIKSTLQKYTKEVDESASQLHYFRSLSSDESTTGIVLIIDFDFDLVSSS